MVRKVHPISSYNYCYDARAGAPTLLQLWGFGIRRADISLIDDSAPVPAPTISPYLSTATVFFSRSALPGLLLKLRDEKRPALAMTSEGVSLTSINGLADSQVVCTACAPDLIAAKTRGIMEAMRRLVAFCGADALPDICPVTFHLNGDGYCGTYQSTYTGTFSTDSSGVGHICLYDVEKENRALPFTPANAEKIQDQLLVVHEAMHGWFVGRQKNYAIQEPFCKMTSFVISQQPGGPDYVDYFKTTPADHVDVLMKYLMELGMTAERTGQTLRLLAQQADQNHRALSDLEFANVVTSVLGKDAIPAFRAAHILP